MNSQSIASCLHFSKRSSGRRPHDRDGNCASLPCCRPFLSTERLRQNCLGLVRTRTWAARKSAQARFLRCTCPASRRYGGGLGGQGDKSHRALGECWHLCCDFGHRLAFACGVKGKCDRSGDLTPHVYMQTMSVKQRLGLSLPHAAPECCETCGNLRNPTKGIPRAVWDIEQPPSPSGTFRKLPDPEPN